MRRRFRRPSPHRIARVSLVAWVPFLLAVLASPARAEEETTDTYAEVRFPHMSGGRIRSEVLAGVADALGMSDAVRRINVTSVEILVYGEPPPDHPPGTAPPVKMRIVGDRGVIESRRGPDGGNEDYAHIEGDVRAYRYDIEAEDERTLDAVITCGNATWNHTRQVLEGAGPASMLQRGSVLKGSDFHYWASGSARALNVAPLPGEEPGSGGDESGWFKLDRNVSMEFVRRTLEGAGGEVAPPEDLPLGVPPDGPTTLITCDGAGVYDLDSGKVHFQDNVRVEKEGMRMGSGRLRALLNDRAEVRSVIAWSDVEIRGETRASAGGPESPYTAIGNYARYRADTEELFLSDQREGRLPRVVYGRDEIRDVNIRLDTRTGALEAYGGEGEARLHARMSPGESGPLPAPRLAVIRYTDRLDYSRAESRCRFTGDVDLRQEGLHLQGEEVVAGMGEVQSGADTLGIRHLTAVGDVRVERDGKTATGARAEMDVQREEIVLFGPPKPAIVEEGVWEMQAERIESIQVGGGDQPGKKSIIRTEGPGSGKFLPSAAREAADRGEETASTFRQTIVTYTTSMDYDETRGYAFFVGDVITTSQDYVLKSDRLEVELEEERYWDAESGTESVRQQPRLITAQDNASLFWHRRNCVADRIVRDEQKQIMVFYGTEDALAVVYEEGGSTIRSPRIIASADGKRAHASGVGEVILPDASGDDRAVVTFEGEARYETLSAEGEGRSRIRFERNVRMRRSDGMVIQGDEMIVDLEEVRDPARIVHRMLSPTPGDEARPRRLRRVVMNGDVIVRQGTMVGYGSRGELNVRQSGEVTVLEGTDRGRAEVVDATGFRLKAPVITHWNDRQLLAATGPGVIHMRSLEPVRGRVGGFDEAEEVDYTLEYDGNLNYNALARKIMANRNVRLSREFLRCTCDEMTVILEEPLEEGFVVDGPSLTLRAVEARGNVRYTSFEPLREESYLDPFNDRREWANRPGTIIKTKSEEAYYDVPAEFITLTGDNPEPKLLQQVLTDDPDARPRRTQFDQDVIGIFVGVPSAVNAENPRIRTLPSTGPLMFDDE